MTVMTDCQSVRASGQEGRQASWQNGQGEVARGLKAMVAEMTMVG